MQSWESDRVRTVVGGDAVVVDHAAGVESVAGLLAGAAAVQDPAVLPVPQQRRDFHYQGQGGWTKKKANQYPFSRTSEGLMKAEKQPASGKLVRQKNCRLRKFCPLMANTTHFCFPEE